MKGEDVMELDFAFYTDEGGRENNEDAYIAKKMEQEYLFVVADGLGGHDDGELASQCAVSSIKDHMTENDAKDVEGAIKSANAAILEMQLKHSSKMKTTVALAYVSDENVTVAHVGDSRVYAFKRGKVAHQTVDHSASQLAVTMGDIRPDEIRNHEDRNVLLRALGVSDNVKVDVSVISRDECDALLLCSDGFWEYVLEDEMEKALSESQAADKWLYKMKSIQMSRAPKRCDNNTAIAVIL